MEFYLVLSIGADHHVKAHCYPRGILTIDELLSPQMTGASRSRRNRHPITGDLIHNSSESVPDQGRISRTFKEPGFPWIWSYSLFAATAFTIELVSQGWLILQLTNSALWVGLAASIRGCSQAIFSVVGGPLADRVDRRKILLITQPLAAASALAMALLLLSGKSHLWHVLIYLVVVELLNATSRPSAAKLMYEIVGDDHFMSASALHFMAGSAVRTVGAILGGIALDRFGVAYNYLLVAAAYLAGGAALLLLRQRPDVRKLPVETLGQAIGKGAHYAWHVRRIRELLLFSLVVEACGFAYLSMMPVMARDVLHVGGIGLGCLVAMVGVGQLAASLLLAHLGDTYDRVAVLVIGAMSFGGFVILFGLSPWFAWSLIAVTIVGMTGKTYEIAMTPLLMSSAHVDMRGRVIGAYYSTMGLGSLGWFVVGAVATSIGLPIAIAASGGFVVLSTLIMAPRLAVRPAMAQSQRKSP